MAVSGASNSVAVFYDESLFQGHSVVPIPCMNSNASAPILERGEIRQ